MTYCLAFELPGLPKTANARLHWRARHRENQKWSALVRALCAGKRPRSPLKRAKLTLTRYSAQPMDFDNLVTGFKPVTDGLVQAGILADDDWDTIGVPEFHWEKCPPRAGRIRIRVEAVETEKGKP